MGNLIALGQVGIEIVLAVKLGKACDVAVESLSGNRSQLNISLAYAGHCTWQSKAYRTYAGVGHSTITIFACTECLCFCQKLSVNLTADYDFPFINCHLRRPPWSPFVNNNGRL